MGERQKRSAGSVKKKTTSTVTQRDESHREMYYSTWESSETILFSKSHTFPSVLIKTRLHHFREKLLLVILVSKLISDDYNRQSPPQLSHRSFFLAYPETPYLHFDLCTGGQAFSTALVDEGAAICKGRKPKMIPAEPTDPGLGSAAATGAQAFSK